MRLSPGAFDAGASEVLVSDFHGDAQNITAEMYTLISPLLHYFWMALTGQNASE
jgi:hypothetical protein